MKNEKLLSFKNARPSTDIAAAKDPLPIEVDEIINTVEDFFKKAGAESYMAVKSGLTKNANSAFKLSTFLKSINLILMSVLKESNKDKLPLLNSYIKGLNEQLGVLDNMNLKLAERQFICNIIGYTINCYKNNTFKEIKK